MPPEIKNFKNTDFKFDPTKSDIFSLGLLTLFYLDTVEFREEKDLNVDKITFETYLNQFGFRLKNKIFSMC